MNLLRKFDTNLIDEAEVWQIFELTVTVDAVAYEATFTQVD